MSGPTVLSLEFFSGHCSIHDIFENPRHGKFSTPYQRQRLMLKILESIEKIHSLGYFNNNLATTNIIAGNLKEGISVKFLDWSYASKAGAWLTKEMLPPINPHLEHFKATFLHKDYRHPRIEVNPADGRQFKTNQALDLCTLGHLVILLSEWSESSDIIFSELGKAKFLLQPYYLKAPTSGVRFVGAKTLERIADVLAPTAKGTISMADLNLAGIYKEEMQSFKQ
jgi:serine/threonine protein kinase